MKNTSLKHQFILIIGLSLLLHLIILVLFLLFSRYQHYKDSTKLAYEKQMEHGKEKVKREVLQMYNIIDFELEIYKQNVKKRIMERAYEGYSIAWSIFNKYKNEKSEAEIKAMIVSALHNVRFFNGRGYYFINDMDANVVMSPIMPEEVGNSYINTTEVDNKSVLKKIITTVNKQKEGFITYKTYLPESELPTTNSYYKKISFVKLFEPFNWIIGTGDYRYGNIIELKDKVIKMINRRKYGVNGYFFVYDFNGLCLSLPADRSREYSNLIGMKDVTGESVIKKAISIASKGGGFMTWYFKSLVEDKPLKKIGYI
jgi:signal transduction histidine kinase